MNLLEIQKQFNLDQIWILSVQASFQRANVYKGHENKSERKQLLRTQIVQLAGQYMEVVSEEQHICNIETIVCQDKAGLNINFGVAQKLLNLY